MALAIGFSLITIGLCLPHTALADAAETGAATMQTHRAWQLTASTPEAKAGYFELAWHPEGADADAPTEPAQGTVLILQQSQTPEFSVFHQWRIAGDKRFTVSGLSNGDYFYRLRADATHSPWSETVKVTVAHHTLDRAWSFFGAGLILFIALVATILHGRRHADTQTASP